MSWFTNARISMLQRKIELQRTELSNLRRKRERVSRLKLEALEQELEFYRKDHLKIGSLERDVKSMTEDNERLRDEVIRLSGGIKSTGRSMSKQPDRYVPVICQHCLHTAYFMLNHVCSGMIKYAQDFKLLNGTVPTELYDLERCGSCGKTLEGDVHPESRTVI